MSIEYMSAISAEWPSRPFVQQAAAQIPWFHNCVLLDRVPDAKAREWYIAQAIAHGWSRNILALQIDNRAHERHGRRLNVYLSAADDLLRHPDDKPAIGLLFCRSKNKIVVEYALRHLKRPIGVAEWETQIVEKLPEEEIEAELGAERRRG